jgi:hypothetical protein
MSVGRMQNPSAGQAVLVYSGGSINQLQAFYFTRIVDG